MKPDDRLVLVGVVRRWKDLEIALSQKWYRIPLQYAPKRKADFLALYQTLAFGREGKAIGYYASIKGSSLVKRYELLPDEHDHPRANETYLKLNLAQFKRTPRRIENRSRRRMSFGFTTLAKLREAEEVSQLFDIVPVEEILRKALIKNGIKAYHEYLLMDGKRCRYRLDFAIFCKEGKIAVECDNEKWHSQPARRARDRERDRWLESHGWMVLHFPGKRISGELDTCIASLKNVIDELGGLGEVN